MKRCTATLASACCLIAFCVAPRNVQADGKYPDVSTIRCVSKKIPHSGHSIEVSVIMIGDQLFAQVPGQGADMSAKERGEKIVARLQALADNKAKLKRDDIKIKFRGGEYFVSVPDKYIAGGVVITADHAFAKQYDLTEKNLATKLKNDLWVGIHGRSHMLLMGAMSPEECFERGMKAYDEGNLEMAEKMFQTAVDKKPDYAAAWLNLCSVQIEPKRNGCGQEDYGVNSSPI